MVKRDDRPRGQPLRPYGCRHEQGDRGTQAGLAAAYGGGGLSLLGAGLYGVLTAEAKFARYLIGEAKDTPQDPTGWYGRGRPGPGIRLALLGDSSAAGYGVDSVEETTGAVLASGVALQADRRVHLRSFAKVGARSADLAGQVDRALTTHPDVVVIFIGANDVTHQVLPSASVRSLAEAVRRLVEAGVEVVVGTCPDLGTIKPIGPPLEADRPLLVTTLGRRPDHRRRRGGRAYGLARLHPRRGVPGHARGPFRT